jgi:rare lipoprotein A
MRAILATAIFCLLAPLPVSAEVASWYGRESGPRTASGERFDPNAMTAAMLRFRGKAVPFGTYVRVINESNGHSVVVRINDRGPAKWTHRDIDLSQGAARRIGCGGVCRVELEIVEQPYRPAKGAWGAF